MRGLFTELINLALENLLFFALHLESGGVFPKPLSAAEEEECFRKMGEGDSAARNKLIEHNLRLVAHIIKKYYNVTTDQEDLISIGTIGLIKAVSTFDYAKKTRFATYASRCIENEILMFLRRSNRIKGEVSIDEPLNQDGDGNELLLSDILGTDPDVTSRRIEDEVDKSLLRDSIGKLNNRERNIMELRFGFISGTEKTQKEVADMLRNFTKLHITFRKENYKQDEKRDYEQDGIKREKCHTIIE